MSPVQVMLMAYIPNMLWEGQFTYKEYSFSKTNNPSLIMRKTQIDILQNIWPVHFKTVSVL